MDRIPILKMGDCLLVRYREADQGPGVAEKNRENERRRQKWEAYRAAYREQNPGKPSRLTRAAVCGPFAEAIALIADMTGVVVPMRSAEAIVKDAAADFEDFYATRAGKAPGPREILVGAIDCKGIPMVNPDGAQKVVRRRKGE